MGEQQEVASPKLNLESIVDSEIFKQEKNIFKRAKQTVEKIIIHNKNKIIIPLSTLGGGLFYYYVYKAMESLSMIKKAFQPDSSITDFPLEYSLITGLGIGGLVYISLDDFIKKRLGKKIYGIKESGGESRNKKENFVFRHKLELTLLSWGANVAYYANKFHNDMASFPLKTKQAINQNIDKFIFGASPFALGLFCGIYMFFYLMGNSSIFKKSIEKEALGELLHKFKIFKKKSISYLENESKKGNIYADMGLAELKENIDEKLDYQRRVIEKVKQEPVFYGKKINLLKMRHLGYNYFQLRKGSITNLIWLAIGLYEVNPSRSISLLNKLSEARSGDIGSHVLSTRNYLLNIHEDDKKEDWQELRSWLEKGGKLQLIEGSEGRTSSFFDDFTNKNFIFKDYKEDKSNKFFIERAIRNILKDSEISVENPLFYYNEGNDHKQVFIRNGEKNLRETLENKSIAERQECFGRVLPLLLLYQQKIFSALERNGSEFVVNVEFRGEKRKIDIPVLDLEKNLMRRAFLGSKPSEIRLGENEYLPSLLLKIQEYNQLNQYAPVFIFNHGDAVITNITETLCVIDPRPRIAHPLYDLAYVSCDPAFLSLSFDSRREKVLETSIKNDGFLGMEADFIRAFDPLYLNVALCNAGANLYLGKREYARMLLNDLLEFSKGKPFEKELMIYLKHSNASS